MIYVLIVEYDCMNIIGSNAPSIVQQQNPINNKRQRNADWKTVNKIKTVTIALAHTFCVRSNETKHIILGNKIPVNSSGNYFILVEYTFFGSVQIISTLSVALIACPLYKIDWF